LKVKAYLRSAELSEVPASRSVREKYSLDVRVLNLNMYEKRKRRAYVRQTASGLSASGNVGSLAEALCCVVASHS